MRNNENNIIFNVRNITLNLENIKRYLTEKTKIITLVSIIIMLSFVNIIDVSALSYSSNIGLGFTFNPALSVSLSSSDLTISELPLGTTGTSNEVNVLVRSNASYGYTLSATVGNNSTYNSDSLINNVDSNKVFSNIALDADLSSLNDSTNTNIWGYSYKDNTVDTPTWSNYNGLALYSSTNPTTLIDLNSNTATGTSSLDFKIAAKASTTQPSGEYSNIINFMAVSKVGTVSLLDAFVASNATMQNGYYTMQGMTPAICNAATIGSSLQLLDVRDGKLYWVTKLADNNCWMTQNLDLDLDSNRTYTHWDTDLGWSDSDNLDTNATWQPIHSTIDFVGMRVDDWVDSYTEPYSANPGPIYYYTSNSDINDIKYDSLQECISADHIDCAHYHAGNYYNWSAAVASNDTSDISNSAPDSVCPKGWMLSSSQRAIHGLLRSYNISDTYSYNYEAFRKIRTAPLYFNKPGTVEHKKNEISVTRYWYGYLFGSMGREYSITNTSIFVGGGNKFTGGSIRCLAR